MQHIVILLGVPGSGKGTQAEFLGKEQGYEHISTGDILRHLAGKQDALPDEVQAVLDMKKGDMAPDHVVFRHLFAKLDNDIPEGKSIVIDGAPRSIRQAEILEEYFTRMNVMDRLQVFEIHVPDEEILKRLEMRRAAGVRRVDDDPEIMKHRIEQQGNASIAVLVNFYKERNQLKVIDGLMSINDVHKAIVESIHE